MVSKLGQRSIDSLLVSSRFPLTNEFHWSVGTVVHVQLGSAVGAGGRWRSPPRQIQPPQVSSVLVWIVTSCYHVNEVSSNNSGQFSTNAPRWFDFFFFRYETLNLNLSKFGSQSPPMSRATSPLNHHGSHGHFHGSLHHAQVGGPRLDLVFS